MGLETPNKPSFALQRKVARLRETSTAFVVGNSRCGKTETLKQFIRRKTGNPFPNDAVASSMFIEGDNSRFVFLDCTVWPPLFGWVVWHPTPCHRRAR